MSQVIWPRVAVVGAGAVGCFFGAKLAKAGAAVTLIGRAPAMQAIADHGLEIIGQDYTDRVHLQTSIELSAAATCDLILLCVKTSDTVPTAKALVSFLRPATTMLSLQNGVDNVERIFDATGLRAIPAAVYVAVEMSAPGKLLHRGRGDLSIGAFPFQVPADASAERLTSSALENIAAWFEASGVPCIVSKNVLGELWAKFIVNCAVNAISALTQTPYGRMLEQPDIKTLISALVRETVAVAHAHGVQLKQTNHEEAVFQVMKAMSAQYSSTAQDLARGKPTEIDALNGYVSKIAKLHALEAPLNTWLTAMVKLRASSQDRSDLGTAVITPKVK